MKKEAADGGAVAAAGVAVTTEHHGGRAVMCEGSWLATAGEGAPKQLRVAGSKERAVKIERGQEKVEAATEEGIKSHRGPTAEDVQDLVTGRVKSSRPRTSDVGSQLQPLLV